MSETVATPETPNPAPVTPVTPAPDKYEGLDDATKAQVKHLDELYANAPPDEKLAYHDAAMRGMKALKEEAERKLAEARKQEAPKGDLDALKDEVKALREQLAAGEKRSENLRIEQQFQTDIARALDAEEAFKEDGDIRASIETEITGMVIAKRIPIPQAIKQVIERRKKQLGVATDEGRRKYLADKAKAARETKGETGAGAPPAKPEEKFTGRDLLDRRGKVLTKLREAFAK